MKFKKQKLLTVVVFLFLLTTLALAACGAKAHDFSDGEWEGPPARSRGASSASARSKAADTQRS